MSNIENFVAALSLNNMVDAKEAFESALALKISDKFEAKRIELASEVSESTKTDVDELDEASSEGTIRIIDLSDRSQNKVRKELGVDGLPDKGFQVQRMTKGKFVNQGKPYKSRKDAEEVKISGQHSMQFEAFGLNGKDLTKREVQQELKKVNDGIKKLEDRIKMFGGKATRGDKEHLDNLKKTRDELVNAKDHKGS